MAKPPIAPSGQGTSHPSVRVVPGKPAGKPAVSPAPGKPKPVASSTGVPKTAADDAATTVQGSVSGGTFYGDGSGKPIAGQQEGV